MNGKRYGDLAALFTLLGRRLFLQEVPSWPGVEELIFDSVFVFEKDNEPALLYIISYLREQPHSASQHLPLGLALLHRSTPHRSISDIPIWIKYRFFELSLFMIERESSFISSALPIPGCSGVMTWFASSHRNPYRSPSSLQMKERTRKRHGDTRFDYSIHEENKIAAESNGIILNKFFFLVLRERLAVRYANDPQF